MLRGGGDGALPAPLSEPSRGRHSSRTNGAPEAAGSSRSGSGSARQSPERAGASSRSPDGGGGGRGRHAYSKQLQDDAVASAAFALDGGDPLKDVVADEQQHASARAPHKKEEKPPKEVKTFLPAWLTDRPDFMNGQWAALAYSARCAPHAPHAPL